VRGRLELALELGAGQSQAPAHGQPQDSASPAARSARSRASSSIRSEFAIRVDQSFARIARLNNTGIDPDLSIYCSISARTVPFEMNR
jgi:hypothetical protein